MPQGNRRSIGMMAQGAVVQQKDAEIEALRQQLEQLRTELEDSGERQRAIEIPLDQVIPLQIESRDGQLELIQQPRTYFDMQGIEDLAHSIRANGLRDPIVVRELATGAYGLLDGERRWRAHQLLNADSIWAFVVQDIGDSDALEWAIATDSLKEKVSPLEQTLAVVNLLRLRLDLDEARVRATLHALNNYSVGNSSNLSLDDATMTTIQGVLNSLGLKLGSLVARLPLLDLPDDLRSGVANGTLSPTNALLIGRAPTELHPRLLAEGATLSKAKLTSLIRSLKLEAAREASQGNRLLLPESVDDRWKKIKRSKLLKAGNDTQLNRKLQKLDALLEEIGDYIDRTSDRTFDRTFDR